MALSVKCGSFSTETATGNKAYTGVGFQPKALILWCVGATSAGAFQAHAQVFYGIATGATEQFNVGGYFENGQTATPIAKRFWQTKVLSFVGVDEVLQVEGSFVSFDADGFTINYTTVNATTRVVHYMALGGADLTNAKALQWAITTAAVGANKAVTGVGFQADAVLHIYSHQTAAQADPPTLSGNAKISLGGAVGTIGAGGTQFASGVTSQNSINTDTQRAQRTDRCLIDVSSTPGFNYELAHEEFTADGFEYNLITTAGGSHKVMSLFLKGGQYSAGSFNAPNSTGVQDVDSPGFAPAGYFLTSFCQVAGSSAVNNSRQAVGGSDGTANNATVFVDDNNVSTSNVDCESSTTKAVVIVNNATPAVSAEAHHDAFDANGFDLNWTTVHGTDAYEVCFMAFGSAAAAGQPMAARWHGVPGSHTRPAFGGRW